MTPQIIRAINELEEDIYPVSVALGQAAAQVLTSAVNQQHMIHDLARLSSDAIKWSDVLDFIKNRLTWHNWRTPIATLPDALAGYSGEEGFGILFLAVSEQYFLPTFEQFAREQGYDSENWPSAAIAHSIVLRLFKKAIDQMLAEYAYRLAPGVRLW